MFVVNRCFTLSWRLRFGVRPFPDGINAEGFGGRVVPEGSVMAHRFPVSFVHGQAAFQRIHSDYDGITPGNRVLRSLLLSRLPRRVPTEFSAA